MAASPVSVTDPEAQNSTEGDAVSLQIHAGDAGGGALLYTATGLPPGLVLNPTTGLISGNIAPSAAASGPCTTTVTVWDAYGFSASQTFQWNIAAALNFTDPGQQSSVEGASVDLSVRATDSLGSAPSYSATGLPPGFGINPATGEITGTVLAGDAAVGTYQTTVTATDGAYSGSQSFWWDVAPAVTITDPGQQFNAEGDQVSLPVSATDAAGCSLTFGATGLPAGLGIDPHTGVISGTIATGAAASQPYTVTVTATDGPYSASQQIAWTVDPAAPTTPSLGNAAALDAALASLVWPGQGGYGAPGLRAGPKRPNLRRLFCLCAGTTKPARSGPR